MTAVRVGVRLGRGGRRKGVVVAGRLWERRPYLRAGHGGLPPHREGIWAGVAADTR